MLSDMNQERNNIAAEIVEAYMSSLQDLNANSKPHINMLTLLAEENIEYASAIVEAVEAHLQKVRNEVKLPVLYLIDSIVKNVNGSYPSLFAKNIDQTFCNVFEKVDENTKMKMLKLRQTWNDIFPIKKLIMLDVNVHNIDPAWPLSSLPPEAISSKSIIHVNPKFLSRQKVQHSVPVSKMSVAENVSTSEQKLREELLKKQEELINLQKQKQKLELMKQQYRKMERPNIHVKPELIASDGTLKKPILTTVPCNISKSLEKQSSASMDTSPTSNKHVETSLTSDPGSQNTATLQNGDSSNDVEDDYQPELMSRSEHTNETSSLVSASPVKVRVNNNTPFSDNSQIEANADLSLILNDNKCLDNDRIQRSSSSSQKKSITVIGDSQSKNSSERSPSKSSSTRASSSSSFSSKQQQFSSSSSNSTSSTSRNKSWSKNHETSSSSTSSSPIKKSKSRKRSRSPNDHHYHHHHHHRHSPKLQQGLDEEEQLGGSLIVSPPQPNTFKDNRDTHQRRDSSGSGGSSRARRCRESSSRSRSPESGREDSNKRNDSCGSKDEDLRSALVAATGGAAAAAAAVTLDSKEDLDLRVLPMSSNKRPSTDLLQISNAKRCRDEKLDDLFGKEDVDLRILTAVPKPAIAQPPTPPPPVISKDKDGWAKFKTPNKSSDSNRSESSRSSDNNRSTSDRNRDRSCRTKLYNKVPENETKDRRRNVGGNSGSGGGRDYERNADRNIEIIMKQAAEQLNQGTITKSQYNKLIQEVLHMSEDQKLRAAQRKERESKIWERNDKGMRLKEHGMHPRPPGGPRWQQPWHQPWAHPPGPFQGHFRPEFRPLGPWQNHPRLFGGPMRLDFHQFHGAFNPRLGAPPMGPNGPIMLPNGPLNPMTGGPMTPMGPMGPLPPGMMLGVGGPMMPKRHSPNTNEITTDGSIWSSASFSSNETKSNENEDANHISSTNNSDELPPADPKILEEISKDTTKSINIDNVPREIRYYGDTGVIFMHWDDPRDIGFQNGARRISIDGKDAVVCTFNDDYREFTYEGEVHKIKLGAPTRELYVDDKWYQCYFGGQPVSVDLGNKKVNVKLDGPPPQVKIGTVKRTDLVLGKINLIINARSMVPVFLDSKKQMFNIDGKSCTLEFIDALQTVLLNGRSFKVEFGGLPKPIIVQSKKHFIRFSVLPRGFCAGYVKIAGMKGEQPKETPEDIAQKMQAEAAVNTTQSAPSPVEPDSTSQDGMDHSYSSKSDLQLDVLSSVVPSAMAPSSGLSYQAEPIENPSAPAPTVTLPLNLNELFQRLVETGIVSSLSEMKKPEEEDKKAPEIIPVSFDKPETLKIKQPAMVTALYSGIQCSSCGARFAPEMATRYSHHLDWHFRQNRKERDSSRKAHSRLWYYDVSDWIQFEEIEDLEDRAQSWFETEKQSMEIENAATEELFTETLQPSVPTGLDEDSCCQVCHEAFEQFYNDEKEEWHLRPTVTYEDKNFHPLCLEDHKRALEVSTTSLDTSDITEDAKDKINDSLKAENNIIKNKDEKNKEDELLKNEEIAVSVDVSECISTEIIEIIEKKIEEIASDTPIEESVQEISKDETIAEISKEESLSVKERNEKDSENVTVEEKIQEQSITIKEESTELQLEPEESIAESPAVDSTQVEVQSTIDGNVKLESTVPTILTQSKIKINIIKNISSPKEVKEKEDKGEIQDIEISEPLKPVTTKLALRDRNLSILPPVQKGEELSALCSIM